MQQNEEPISTMETSTKWESLTDIQHSTDVYQVPIMGRNKA